MAKHEIPEVDIVVDEKAGVIREVKPQPKLRSKKGIFIFYIVCKTIVKYNKHL